MDAKDANFHKFLLFTLVVEDFESIKELYKTDPIQAFEKFEKLLDNTKKKITPKSKGPSVQSITVPGM